MQLTTGNFVKFVLTASPLVFVLWRLGINREGTGVDTHPTPQSSRPEFHVYNESNTNHEPFNANLLPLQSSFLQPVKVGQKPLIALLPVSRQTLSELKAAILSFQNSPSHLRHLVICSPDSTFTQSRRIIKDLVSSEVGRQLPRINLRSCPTGFDAYACALKDAGKNPTQVLVLDHTGLGSEESRQLLSLVAVSLPVGGRGIRVTSNGIVCVQPNANPQAASYLLPPFLISPVAATGFSSRLGAPDIWRKFGTFVASSRRDGVGGIVQGQTDPASWCPSAYLRAEEEHLTTLTGVNLPLFGNLGDQLMLKGVPVMSGPANRSSSSTMQRKIRKGTFALLFPLFEDLRSFSRTACALQDNGFTIRVFLFGRYDKQLIAQANRVSRCRLAFDLLSAELSDGQSNKNAIGEWLNTFDRYPDVILTIKESNLRDFGPQNAPDDSVVIQLPRADLAYAEWASSLTLQEWKNWHRPQIDLSIITKDRPNSLRRLLRSLSTGILFSDHLSLRVNLEQSADPETLEIIREFTWPHGTVFVHHRVIHGGLLPAVAESWYPSSDDHYGLLLEDDVELSPLFYAWAKMAVLRYRYGSKANNSPHLFGVSLYQQKNLELLPDGRHPFDAHTLFAKHGLPLSTPYLSQIPCSWGAIYFPDHWREFHTYLTLRLSEAPFPLSQTVVPEIRSNRWTRSWKKYFIELAYLKGYVMLYPNFGGFESLSTNHLEVGSHVRDRGNKEKRALFLLPLMGLPEVESRFGGGGGGGMERGEKTGLLGMPGGTLPLWKDLPVLNLTGSVISLESAKGIGRARMEELSNCSGKADVPYTVESLMCPE